MQQLYDRFESAKALLDYGFANWRLYTPDLLDIASIPVTFGTVSEITPVLKDATPVLLEKGKTPEQRIELDESVTAPVEAGQQLGTIYVTAGEETIAELPLVASEEVRALAGGSLTCRMLRALCLCDA